MSFSREQLQTELKFQTQQQANCRRQVEEAAAAMHQAYGAVQLLTQMLVHLDQEGKLQQVGTELVGNGAGTALGAESLGRLLGGRVEDVTPVAN